MEISLSRLKDFGVSAAAVEVELEVSFAKRPFAGGGGGDWSILRESQLLPWPARLGGDAVAYGFGNSGLEVWDCSHAERVDGSTGQISGAAGDPSLAIVDIFNNSLEVGD